MSVYIQNIMRILLILKQQFPPAIGTANTEQKEKLDSLLTLNFQSFAKVQILTV
jgi:hypothetical protein